MRVVEQLAAADVVEQPGECLREAVSVADRPPRRALRRAPPGAVPGRRPAGTGPRSRSGRSSSCPRLLAAPGELRGRRAAAELGFHLRERRVDLARTRHLGQLAVDVVLALPESADPRTSPPPQARRRRQHAPSCSRSCPSRAASRGRRPPSAPRPQSRPRRSAPAPPPRSTAP